MTTASQLPPPGTGPAPDADDDFEGGRAPLPLDQLEAHARQLAAEHSSTGSGGPRRELLARLERNAARLEQIYKKLSEAGLVRAGRDAVRGVAARQPLRRPGAAARNPPKSSAAVTTKSCQRCRRAMAPLSARLCVRARFRHPHRRSLRSGVAAPICRRVSGRHAAHDRRAVGHSHHAAAGARREPLRSRRADAARAAGQRRRADVCDRAAADSGDRAAAAPAHRQGLVDVPRRDSSQPARSVGRLDRRVAMAADAAERARSVVGRSAAHRAAARGHRSALDRQHHQHHARAVGARLADVRRGGQPGRANPAARSGRRVRRHGSADARSVPEVGRAAVATIGHRRARGRRARHRVRGAAHARAPGRRSRASRRVLPDLARPIRARAGGRVRADDR